MSRYVDAEWLIKESMPLDFSVQKWVNEVQIMTAPSIDICFCRECEHHEDFPTGISPLTCSLVWGGVFENDFCSYGERKVSEKPTGSERSSE